MASNERGHHSEIQLNSVQLNIVTLIDMQKALASGNLDGAMYMTDNSVGGKGRGTAQLETLCRQGQILNWIIRPIDINRRADGTWPPMPKISNVVFLDTEVGSAEDVAESKVCKELKIYGMPDRVRSPATPTYYYWAGMVDIDLSPGTYPYRLVLGLERETPKGTVYLDTKVHPSLRVVPLAAASPDA